MCMCVFWWALEFSWWSGGGMADYRKKKNLCLGGVISYDANSAKQCGSKISRCGRHIGKRGGVKVQSEMKEKLNEE